MRLIDADWVLDHLKPYEPSDEEWIVTGGTALRLIHNAVDNAPTVDAVVITRCKGCKYAYINSFAVSSGEALCTLSGKPMQQDDFCSYGEPKEEPHADDHD